MENPSQIKEKVGWSNSLVEVESAIATIILDPDPRDRIVLVGLPASGKSYLLKQFKKRRPDLHCVDYDVIRSVFAIRRIAERNGVSIDASRPLFKLAREMNVLTFIPSREEERSIRRVLDRFDIVAGALPSDKSTAVTTVVILQNEYLAHEMMKKNRLSVIMRETSSPLHDAYRSSVVDSQKALSPFEYSLKYTEFVSRTRAEMAWLREEASVRTMSAQVRYHYEDADTSFIIDHLLNPSAEGRDNPKSIRI